MSADEFTFFNSEIAIAQHIPGGNGGSLYFTPGKGFAGKLPDIGPGKHGSIIFRDVNGKPLVTITGYGEFIVDGRSVASDFEMYRGFVAFLNSAGIGPELGEKQTMQPNDQNFNVLFHGGPVAGERRAYPSDPGDKIAFSTSNGSEVVYTRDVSDLARAHHKETGLHVYECVFNGVSLEHWPTGIEEPLTVEEQADEPITREWPAVKFELPK